MSSSDKIYVSIVVTNFERDPDEITQMTGIQPSEVRRKGSFRAITVNGEAVSKMPVTRSSWVLDSNLPAIVPVEEHIESLLAIMSKQGAKFLEVARQFTAELSVAFYSSDPNPGVHISSSTLGKLAELGLELDLDIYCLPEDE